MTTVRYDFSTHNATITWADGAISRSRSVKSDVDAVADLQPPLITAHRPAASTWKRTRCGWQNGEHLNHSANPQWPVADGLADIPTKWGAAVTAARAEAYYPRPQLVRFGGGGANLTALRDHGDPATWSILGGLWEWQPAPPGNASSGEFNTTPPFGQRLAKSILVPFPVEACLSGVAPLNSNELRYWMHYRLVFDAAAAAAGERTLLHFGAVDWKATVYLNKKKLGEHTGGYDSFSFDISSALQPTGNELIVAVFDPSDSGDQPQGKQKQGAISNPGWPPLNGSHRAGNPNPMANWFATFGIVYTPSSGIWGAPWIERVPSTYIDTVRINQASTTTVVVNVSSAGAAPAAGATASITVMDGAATVAETRGRLGVPVAIAIPNPKLWSPESPFLYDLRISLKSSGGGADTVVSYFGLRTFDLPTVPNGGGSPGTAVMHDVDLTGKDMDPCLHGGCGSGCCGVKGKNDTIGACKALCLKTQGCEGYVFSGPAGACGRKTTCWLKKLISPPAGGWPSGNRTCRDSQVLPQPGSSYLPLLNGNRTFLTGTLDQSWWPDGEYTAPSEAALESDLVATKHIGFNAIRLHQKVNPERWYYHADRLGLAIFQDVPEKYVLLLLLLILELLRVLTSVHFRYGHPSNATIPLYLADLEKLVGGPRANHPCIVQWEPFNEGDMFAAFNSSNLPSNSTKPSFDAPFGLQGIVDLMRKLDPTRLVDLDSGGGANKFGLGDVNDLHTYTDPRDVAPVPGRRRYGMIGEYSNVASYMPGHEWQPGRCKVMKHMNTSAQMADYMIYTLRLIEQDALLGHVSASVYTQTTDVEDECDGWMSFDRVPKFDANQTACVVAAQRAIIAAAKKAALNQTTVVSS